MYFYPIFCILSTYIKLNITITNGISFPDTNFPFSMWKDQLPSLTSLNDHQVFTCMDLHQYDLDLSTRFLIIYANTSGSSHNFHFKLYANNITVPELCKDYVPLSLVLMKMDMRAIQEDRCQPFCGQNVPCPMVFYEENSPSYFQYNCTCLDCDHLVIVIDKLSMTSTHQLCHIQII